MCRARHTVGYVLFHSLRLDQRHASLQLDASCSVVVKTRSAVSDLRVAENLRLSRPARSKHDSDMAPKQASASQAKKRKRNDNDQPSPRAPPPQRRRTSAKSTRRTKPNKPNADEEEQREEDGLEEKETFRDGQSVREAARPFLLGVAMMPLSVMSTQWSNRQNRALDPEHVAELKASFAKIGIERTAEENRLRVLCSRAAFTAVKNTDGRSATPNGVINFLDWAQCSDEVVEVMAGQHRIQALVEYNTEVGSDAPDQLWWTCELYDKGVFVCV